MHSFARHLCFLLLVSLLGSGGVAFAAIEPLVLSNQQSIKLAPHIEYFREEHDPLSLEAATLLPDTRWQRSTAAGYMVLGLTEKSYWLRFSLNVTTDKPWEFTLRYFSNCSVEVFLRARDAQGNAQAFQKIAETRRWDQRHFSFSLPVQAGNAYDVYMRATVPGPDKFALVIEDHDAKKHYDLWDNRWVGVFYGGFITMLLYNLFLAVSTRSFTYGYYLMYMVSMMAYLMMMDGLWQAQLSHYYIAVCAVAAFGCQFCRHFLHTPSRLPGPDRFIVGIIVCSLLLGGMLIVFGPLDVLTTLVMVLVGGYGLVLGSVALLSRIRGNHVARFFLLAWVFPLLGMIYTDLMFTGVVPFTDVGYSSMNIATLAEAILLSMALADRINALRSERQRAVVDAKQKLEMSNRALEKANRLKDGFLGTISHELRTPMNGIIGTLELLKTSSIDQNQRECLMTLENSSSHMLSMVERILLFSELQSGSMKLHPATLDVRGWCARMERDWSSKFQDKGLRFSVLSDSACSPWIDVDVRKLDQLVAELLSNALKFTPQGEVQVRLGQTQESNGVTWVLEISDSGIGIPDEQLLRISDAFQQGQSAYNRQYGGLGIGMAICRELVSAMNGEWRVVSEPAKGTCIRLVIPVVVAEAPLQVAVESALPVTSEAAADAQADARPPADTPSLPAALQAPAILVVEDNAVNQMVMKKILESLGWTYCIANNGVEALERAAEKPFALILMDCQMPVMDGFEATRELRAGDSPNRCTPIVAVTANATDQDRETCIACGMNDYLKKPVKPYDIRAIITQYVPASLVEAAS